MPEKFVRKLYFMKNGQAIISVPPVVRELIGITEGDSIRFNIDLKHGKIWIEKVLSPPDTK